jgi:vacuolar-type H+-ATPase subunit I/STV1
MIPCLGITAFVISYNETEVVSGLVLKEARTAALQGAAAYGTALDAAVDGGALSLDEILSPELEVIVYPFHVEETRYTNKLSKYMRSHGVQKWQDAARNAGGFLFFSGMSVTGLVPVTNSFQDLPPRGDSTPEDAAWDRAFSRGGRQYRGGEQKRAVEFEATATETTLVQPYKRDTGEWAWDVAAPILVKGHHFGGLRVGVSRDVIDRQNHRLILGLSLLFGVLAVSFTVFVFLFLRLSIRPLVELSQTVRELSVCSSYEALGVRIISTSDDEIGEMVDSANRLRVSLYKAMELIEKGLL